MEVVWAVDQLYSCQTEEPRPQAVDARAEPDHTAGSLELPKFKNGDGEGS